MINDALLQPSGSVVAGPAIGQSLVGAAGTTTSTNVIDLAGAANAKVADMGAGKQMNFVLTVTQAFAGGTSMQPVLVLADDAAISVNVEVIAQKAAIPIAQLTLGTQIPINFDRAAPLPPRRYLAIQYVTVGTMTAGAVTASMAGSPQDRSTIYNGGFVVA